MKKYKNIILLQLYAFVLALLHIPRGVTTDEAKYLLNIPYPHPPFARWLMGITEWMPIQELFWRIVIATIVIQSVWFVWDMGRSLTEEQRKLLASFWLLSAAVLLQAGTIMMAPLTAVQALIFIWLLDRHALVEKFPALVALFWLVSLFTAYQIALFLPIVILVFWKTSLKQSEKLSCIGAPLVLLALYTLANPLVLASILDAGAQNVSLSSAQKLEYIVLLWAVGGSLILSGLGTVGMVLKKRWELLLALALLLVYISLSYRFYYAILFTPLFIAGVVAAPRVLCSCRPYNVLLGIISIGMFLQFAPTEEASAAKQVAFRLRNADGIVHIYGPRGHEWQYEIRQPLRKFDPEELDGVVAVVCTADCEAPVFDSEVAQTRGGEYWHRLDSLPVDVWVLGK